ncbi:MAG: nitrogen regulation protein NR(II) [Acidiferrobacterales bacterium]
MLILQKENAPAEATPTAVMPTSATDSLLDNLTTAVMKLDRDLRLTFINAAGEMLFEVSAKKVLGRTLAELLPRSRVLARRLRQSLRQQAPFTARGVRLLLPAHQSITVDCTVSPLTDDGTDVGLLVELTQVDRLLRLAKEEKMIRRQSVNRALVKGLAHEIKNPLGGLRGAAQLLERELADDTLKEYTSIIIREADRLRHLVDRMVGPSQPLNRQPVNLHEILEHVCNLVLAENPQGIRIERDYDPSLPPFAGDPAQLIQAVLNIVRNSVEAVNGCGRIELRTSIERQFTIGQKRYRLALRADVQDDGPGVSEDLLDSIFYPMVTDKPEGSGLGLAIAQDIINKHGGLIECSSRPKETVFSIYLPLEETNG